jgi:hypothetical protein
VGPGSLTGIGSQTWTGIGLSPHGCGACGRG